MAAASTWSALLLLVASACESSSAEQRSSIAVLSGDGNGGFSLESGGSIDYPTVVAIVAAQRDSSGEVLVGFRDGIAVFESAVDESLVGPEVVVQEPTPRAIRVTDLDQDGALDLVVCSPNANEVTIWFGDGRGAFLLGSRYAAAGVRDAVVDDFDANGLRDVAYGVGGAVCVLRNMGAREFSSRCGTATGTWTFALTTGDFNGDGRPDVVLSDLDTLETGSAKLFLGQGDASFQSGAVLPGAAMYAVVAADFNGDQFLDLAAVGGGATLFLGDGAGGFGPRKPLAGTNAFAIAAVDADRDGLMDLAIAHVDEGVGLRTGLGDGAFASEVLYQTGADPLFLATGDLNRDGIIDLVVGDSGGFGPVP